MSRSLTFFLLCEGTSDEALAEHIERLAVRQGAEEVIGIARAGTGRVEDKVRTLRDDGTPFDFVVVHRDADARDPSPRLDEVTVTLGQLGVPGCPVVPVQMTEAWLLTDEHAIRAAVGRPSGRETVVLPHLRDIETTHDPKSVLRAALIAATGASGRRRKKAARDWSTYRRILLERLDIDGPVQQLPSWQRMVNDVSAAVNAALARTPTGR